MSAQAQKTVGSYFVPEKYQIKEDPANSFRRRPDLKLPDGRVLDDLRRSELFKALTELGVPVMAEQGKNALIYTYIKHLEPCEEGTAA